MPMNWTDQADARLLVGIITLHSVKLDHKALAQFMGPDCTPSAIQHRIQRLKEKVQNTSSADNTSSQQAQDDGSAVASPSKPKRGRPSMGGSGSPTKKAKSKASDDSL
ncbi:hypothetical protein BDV29DRAFT_163087 [Aspergillus leporis]|uniref:AT hook motif protein n=1 Tax=Aspergillus leporis TaxID=41062 RepID=A0A5N5WH04_9EURO|nr:hypothetical protein BDV29DRAFT_163087 [Aspergillus leporis]